MRKQFIEVPLPISCSYLDKAWMKVKKFFFTPIFLLIARILGTPGISFYMRCAATGFFLLVTRRASPTTCFHLIFSPMDSTRYFEFHEVWKSAKQTVATRYLDVSSPRLIPLFLLRLRQGLTAELINPDYDDLRETEILAKALGVESRCKFSNCILDKVGFAPASFDLITCISVLEHIPEDRKALETMWTLLAPGGKLILTLPCMSQPLEQYISHNQYGVIQPGNDGYTFWQRYYDSQRLESCIYSLTGEPSHIAVYGEKKSGSFFRNASMKRLFGSLYPFWREPYMMAKEYRYFNSVNDLPGEGVLMLEFIKQGAI